MDRTREETEKSKGGIMKFIDKGFCKEDDPIFTEGITVFTGRRQSALPEEQEELPEKHLDAKKPPEE